MTEQKEGAPAIGISYSVQVDDKRSLVFQTFVPQDADVKAINNLTDKLELVAGRQEAKNNMVKLGKELDMHQKTQARLVDDLARIDNKALIAGTNSTRGQARSRDEILKQDAERTNAQTTLKRFKEEIERIEREIIVEKARVDGTSSTTDRQSRGADS